ncbi:MAG: tRNA lysidine(34) synthetase TilS [Deltaproteobacteria bacterium]|nr:tRNA lysidine(34) synthetase TilS [Deltaproteobacteria bacterium]
MNDRPAPLSVRELSINRTTMDVERHLEVSLKAIVGPDYASQSYVIGVSGGVDSMVLATAMSKLIPQAHLIFAHYNHAVRSDADADEQIVAQLAIQNKIQFETAKAVRQTRHVGEEQLRIQRYAFLNDVVEHHGFDFLMTAHHAEDQLETFLMRLIRGTGVEGLKGMLPLEGRLLRPLLTLPKSSLVEYANEYLIRYREDETNFNERYFRNRVRAQCLPVFYQLASHFGGKDRFLERFSKLTNEFAEISSLRTVEINQLFELMCVQTPFWIRCENKKFLELEQAIQARLLRLIYKRLQISHSPSRDQLASIVADLNDGKVSMDCPLSLSVRESCGHLFFQSKRMSRSHLEFRTTESSVTCDVLGFRAQIESGVGKECEWRTFKPGDRWEGRKLSDVLLDRKIPLPERRILPLLTKKDSREVLWFLSERNERVRVQECQFLFSCWS